MSDEAENRVERRAIIDEALADLRVHIGHALEMKPDELPGIEASVISLVVEVLQLRKQRDEARARVKELVLKNQSIHSLVRLFVLLGGSFAELGELPPAPTASD